jgi:addiction module HigA family antidote
MNLGKRRPTPPGVILHEEFLEPLGVSQSALADHLQVDRKTINRLVNDAGYRISASLALRLASALGTSPEFWLNLSMRCQLWDELKALEGSLPRPLRAVVHGNG